MEAHAEARSLSDAASASKGDGKGDDDVVEEEVEEQVVEETEEEDDDEFDEDANYPMVGHGVSDDISVVSDLTTPTVVNHSQVPEEEHYRDTLPPMIVGGVGEPSMVISAPKRKNLVSQVRPPPVTAIGSSGTRRNVFPAPPTMTITAGPTSMAPAPGGAAAARRKMYQDTMAKLHENPHGMGYVGPSAVPSKLSAKGGIPGVGGGNLSKPMATTKFGTAVEPTSTKGKKKPSSRKSTGHNVTSSNDWGSFDEPAKTKSSKSGGPQTVIDDDGFLVGHSGFDPFATSSNPFKSNTEETDFGSAANQFISSDSSAPGGFGAFDTAFGGGGGGGPSGGGVSKSRKAKPMRRSSTAATGDGGAGGEAARIKTRASATSGTGTGHAGGGGTGGTGGTGRRRVRRMSAV